MKKILSIIGPTIITFVSQAQIGQQFTDFVFTNSAIDIEGLKGLSGDKYIAAFTYAKDITTNAGVLLTYDKCFSPKNPLANQSDQLNGGFELQTVVYPLRHWNANSTFKLNIGGYEQAGIATSGPNHGGAVNVVGTYVDYTYNSFEFGVLYQNRTETDIFSGNYIGAHVGFSF